MLESYRLINQIHLHDLWKEQKPAGCNIAPHKHNFSFFCAKGCVFRYTIVIVWSMGLLLCCRLDKMSILIQFLQLRAIEKRRLHDAGCSGMPRSSYTQDCFHGKTYLLAVVNVETWEVDIPTTHGTGPLPRFGCSIAVWKGKLWVVGGGFGNDLARSGYDHEVG